MPLDIYPRTEDKDLIRAEVRRGHFPACLVLFDRPFAVVHVRECGLFAPSGRKEIPHTRAIPRCVAAFGDVHDASSALQDVWTRTDCRVLSRWNGGSVT